MGEVPYPVKIKMKRGVIFVLVMVLMIACPLNVFAATNDISDGPTMECMIYGSEKEMEEAQTEQMTKATAAGSFQPGIYFSRTSPTSKNVNMYFTITGCKDLSNAIKYSKVKIRHHNLLNRKIYKTLAKNAPVTRSYTAITNGTILMASFDLPTSVEKVRVDWGYVYIYMVNYGWTSPAADPVGQYTIK